MIWASSLFQGGKLMNDDSNVKKFQPQESWNPNDLRDPDASCEEADLPVDERPVDTEQP